MIRGTCEPERLLDLVENFTLFEEAQGGLIKIIAKNHQYLGVNNAFASRAAYPENQGKLGVFWHTQGSGKSYSMVFFAQKVLRKLPGNWTFPDRHRPQRAGRADLQELRQLRRGHAKRRHQVRAASGEHLQQLLREDHRYVFTLIQKFRTERGRDLSAALRSRRHHRHDRRGPPQPVRRPGPQHAQRPAQRRLPRLSPARR